MSSSNPAAGSQSDNLADDFYAIRGDLETSLEHPSDHTSHHNPYHEHVHSEESIRRIVNRLSRIEGHIRGIKTMVQEGKYPEAVK